MRNASAPRVPADAAGLSPVDANGVRRAGGTGLSSNVAPVLAESSLVVRSSTRHGLGVFATRAIAAGTRVLEYTGERISHDEAAERYDDERGARTHTLLFTVDRRTVIDGGAGGGMARYVNHACAPNCEVVLDDGRIFFETIVDVPAGAELAYDYALSRPRPLPRDWAARYACRCGAPACRGTMLARPPRRRR